MLFYISNFFGFKYQDESLKNIAIYMSNIYGSNIWVGGLFYGLSQLKNPCGENEWHQYLQNKVIEKTVLLLYVCVCVWGGGGGGGGLLVCKNDNPIKSCLIDHRCSQHLHLPDNSQT